MNIIQPRFAFAVSAFYDKQNDRLNIPCEGPKVIPVTYVPANNDLVTIDFSLLFNAGTITSLQTVSNSIPSGATLALRDATTGWYISDSAVNTGNTYFVFPIITSKQPKIIVSTAGSGGGLGFPFTYNFYNFCLPYSINN